MLDYKMEKKLELYFNALNGLYELEEVVGLFKKKPNHFIKEEEFRSKLWIKFKYIINYNIEHVIQEVKNRYSQSLTISELKKRTSGH